jgi:hypothetical protein
LELGLEMQKHGVDLCRVADVTIRVVDDCPQEGKLLLRLLGQLRRWMHLAAGALPRRRELVRVDAELFDDGCTGSDDHIADLLHLVSIEVLDGPGELLQILSEHGRSGVLLCHRGLLSVGRSITERAASPQE